MSQPQDELAIDFVESISIDKRLYKYDIAGSLAHARMLKEQKLITPAEFKAIKQGLNDIAEEIAAGKFKFDKRYEDIHMVIEAALIKKIGEPGKKLHTGRSRNDQVALDMRLWLRDTMEIIVEHITTVQRALAAKAQTQGQTVMPAYTHMQRAQPVLTGSYLLAYTEQLERDKQRFSDAWKRVNVCPLGAGAVAGSSLNLDRQRVAELLGFRSVTRNSIDSISDRDFCAEFLFACATTAMHLSRLAEDWIIYSSIEFSFIKIDDAYSTGSSMMPQKRNPDMLELIRGRCGGIYGNLMAMLTILKAQPLSYNRDMQEDKKHVFDAADTLKACLQMTEAIVTHSHFNDQTISCNIDEGFLDATCLAEYLVSKGIAFRQAHQIVGTLVKICDTKNLSALAQLSLEEMQKNCPQITADVYNYLGAANVVKRYSTCGAAGATQLKQQLAFWKKHLK